jgi:hypothetical protein
MDSLDNFMPLKYLHLCVLVRLVLNVMEIQWISVSCDLLREIPIQQYKILFIFCATDRNPDRHITCTCALPIISIFPKHSRQFVNFDQRMFCPNILTHTFVKNLTLKLKKRL